MGRFESRLLRRGRGNYLLLVLCVILTATLAPARLALADRALAPTDRLAGGTLDLRAFTEMNWRRLTLTDSDGETDIRVRALDLGLEGRIWFSSRAALRARVARIMSSAVTENGTPAMLSKPTGFRDLGLDLTYLVDRDRLRFGGSLAAQLPTGELSTDLGRTEVSLGALGSFAAGPNDALFLVADHTHRIGNSTTDAGDVTRLAVGLHHRWGELSLVPSVTALHTFAVFDHGETIESGFNMLRATALAGYEPARGLTAFCAVEYAMAGEHTVQATDRASGGELLVLIGIAYAWDLHPIAAHGGEPPPPAVISMTTVKAHGVLPEAAAEIDARLRRAIPRLRLATLDAERAAGGAHGEMAIELVVAADGRVTHAQVEDHTGCPELARVVRGYYLGQRLPDQDHPATVSLVIDFH